MNIIENPFIPRGTALLLSPAALAAFRDRPIRLTADLWGPPTYLVSTSEVATRERYRALGHLAGLLDGLCERFGLDPDEAWREPRADEQRGRAMRRDRIAYSVRAGFAAVSRPADFVVVTGIS